MSSALIVIGNEILSGRTQDANIAYVGKRLSEVGYPLQEVRVIPDKEECIIETVRALSALYTFVFTTGGIGPTHDDITAAAVAKAFDTPLTCHPEALKILETHYGIENLSATRKKMAYIPEGSALIPNPSSAAPGFKIKNVFVMAGVPHIMQAMLEELIPLHLTQGTPIHSKSIRFFLTESVIAEKLSHIQDAFPTVDIGSYPFYQDGKFGTCLVCRSTEKSTIQQCMTQLHHLIQSFGQTPITDEDVGFSR